MDDLVEIKQEVDIKVVEDEVDTIEYTPPSNQFAEVFVPKVEKNEQDDSDEVDNPWELFERFGYLDSFKSRANTMPRSKAGVETTDTASSSLSHASEENVALSPCFVNNVDNDDGARTVSVTRLRVNTAKKTIDAKSKIKKTASKVQSNSMKKKKQPLECIACDYFTTWSGNLKSHMLKHTGEKPFPCKHCPKRFTRKQILQSHMKVHVKKGSLNCSICFEVFLTNTELVDHRLACKQRRYECHLCKIFSTSIISLLRMHMRVHSGVRPFKCNLCLSKFTQKSSLKTHIKSHTCGINPRRLVLKFQCSVCARKFFEQSERNAHQMNCKCRRYECYLCQSHVTHLKPHLQYHMRKQHTGERPFKCNLCKKRCMTVSNLKRHTKINH